nr:tetratricopeptide repeat protein [Planctomycetota bacterium]
MIQTVWRVVLLSAVVLATSPELLLGAEAKTTTAPKDPKVVLIGLIRRADALEKARKYKEAVAEYLKIVELASKVYGAESHETATFINNLAALHANTGRFDKAEPLYLKSIKIDEKASGKEAPSVA